MSRRRKNSNEKATRKIMVEITPQLAAQHMLAASKILDIILEHCDGPADALYLLTNMAATMRAKYNIEECFDMPTGMIQ